MEDHQQYVERRIGEIRGEVLARVGQLDDLPADERREMLSYALARQGDPSFVEAAIACVLDELLSEDGLSIHAKDFLLFCLTNIVGDNKALMLLAGTRKRGAPKRGVKGLNIARAVALHIIHNGSTSVEDAWCHVALSENVSESTVKKYWSSWKAFLPLVHDGRPSCMKQDFAGALERARQPDK